MFLLSSPWSWFSGSLSSVIILLSFAWPFLNLYLLSDIDVSPYKEQFHTPLAMLWTTFFAICLENVLDSRQSKTIFSSFSTICECCGTSCLCLWWQPQISYNGVRTLNSRSNRTDISWLETSQHKQRSLELKAIGSHTRISPEWELQQTSLLLHTVLIMTQPRCLGNRAPAAQFEFPRLKFKNTCFLYDFPGTQHSRAFMCSWV